MRRSVSWMAGLVIAAQLIGGATASAGSSATLSRGAPGAGDAYFPRDGNGGFWVRHYDLDLRYWPDPGRLDGTATISALTDQPLSRFNLDFLLRAESVTVNGRPAAFHKAGPHELVIAPATPVPAHRLMRVVVSYRDFPRRIKDPNGYSWWHTAKDSTFVNGEPHSAAVWFPLSDHPSDKATYDIRVAVPRRWKAISAGDLVSHRIADTYSVWHWQQTQPMASYLSFLGLGTYTLARGTSGGLSYTYAWSSFFRQPVQAKIHRALAKTPRYVAWLSAHLGPYPFTHIGGTAPGGFAVATIESQSAPVYGHYLFQRASLIKTTMVHELAHQWFGDSVSIRRWHDLWLNEGFAKYMEWWYAAAHGGPTLNQQMLDSYRAIPPRSRWWTIPPGDPGPGRRLFRTVYGRGAMTLQALRNVIGVQDFGEVVRTWTRSHEYTHGTTAQLIDLAERVSGRELDRLFLVWLYRPHRPAHTVANGFPPHAG